MAGGPVWLSPPTHDVSRASRRNYQSVRVAELWPHPPDIRPADADFSTALTRAGVASRMIPGRFWVPSAAVSGDPTAIEIAGALTASGVAQGGCPPNDRAEAILAGVRRFHYGRLGALCGRSRGEMRHFPHGRGSAGEIRHGGNRRIARRRGSPAGNSPFLRSADPQWNPPHRSPPPPKNRA